MLKKSRLFPKTALINALVSGYTYMCRNNGGNDIIYKMHFDVIMSLFKVYNFGLQVGMG